MDDGTKVIIATISGFAAAFFAEPVKLYFQNKQKTDIFRFALYAEIYNNYRLLSTFVRIHKDNEPNQVKTFFDGTIKDSLRIDCYTRLSSQHPDTYYQFKEFIIINMLYSYLTSALDPAIYTTNNVAKFRRSLVSFVLLVEEHIARNELDQRIIKKVCGDAETKAITDAFNKRKVNS